MLQWIRVTILSLMVLVLLLTALSYEMAQLARKRQCTSDCAMLHRYVMHGRIATGTLSLIYIVSFFLFMDGSTCGG
jgi:hypothetical protein